MYALVVFVALLSIASAFVPTNVQRSTRYYPEIHKVSTNNDSYATATNSLFIYIHQLTGCRSP